MSVQYRGNPFAGGGAQRLEALADGVFSIVMTLLVFEISPPKDRPVTDLAWMLYELWPSFLAFVISVGLVGNYWTAHRNQFRIIAETDYGLIWLHPMFLAAVSLLPFSTRLIAVYHTEPLALAIYGGNLSFIGLSLLSVWRHATLGRRLVPGETSVAVIRFGTSRCLLGTCGYGLGAGLAFVSTPAALVVFAAISLLYILPPVQREWRRHFGL